MQSKSNAAAAREAATRRKRTTLAQVAQLAGVSASTASFVLTGRTDQRISTETATRVRGAAESLNYRPNTVAKTLLTGRSDTIAFVSEYVASTPHATRSITGALQEALRHDMLMIVAETLGQPDIERRLLHSMLDRRVDAFLYAAMFTREVVVPQPLRDTQLVLLNCTSADVDVPMVLPDEVGAGRTAARALLEAGHREGIFYIGGLSPALAKGIPKWEGRISLALPARLEGIRAELEAASTTLAGVLSMADDTPAEGRAAVTELLATGVVPKALICFNDHVAIGACQALLAANLSVPEDVSVISFDNTELAEVVQPGLSSVALPHEEMGRLAIQLLLSESPEPGLHLVRMPLVERESIAPPRG